MELNIAQTSVILPHFRQNGKPRWVTFGTAPVMSRGSDNWCPATTTTCFDASITPANGDFLLMPGLHFYQRASMLHLIKSCFFSRAVTLISSLNLTSELLGAEKPTPSIAEHIMSKNMPQGGQVNATWKALHDISHHIMTMSIYRAAIWLACSVQYFHCGGIQNIVDFKGFPIHHVNHRTSITEQTCHYFSQPHCCNIFLHA